MDEIIYNGITSYYKALGKLGYYRYRDVFRLLLLCFYREFTLEDYRGTLSREDYSLIERALNCLFGSTCLIPYPDYLKMGKLHIGEMTEMATRLRNIEETEVLKAEDLLSENGSDIMVIAEEEEQ